MDKRLSDLLAVFFVKTFEGSNGLTGNLRRFQCTRKGRFVVNQYGAAAALRLWLASVLGRGNTQIIAQHIEQGQVIVAWKLQEDGSPIDVTRELVTVIGW
jgi:hypothetical protein